MKRFKSYIIYFACFLFLSVIVTMTVFAQDKNDHEWRNLVLGKEYTTLFSASESYPDEGNQLTDGIYSTDSYGDSNWVGYSLNTIESSLLTQEIVFDLNENASVGEIRAGFLQDTGAGIRLPREMRIYVSTDGENWRKLVTMTPENPHWKQGFFIERLSWKGSEHTFKDDPNADMVYAQYVKLEFPMDIWLFIDEIEILGVPEKVDGAVEIPVDSDTPDEERGYLQPGEKTANIHHLGLLYNGWYADGSGDWEKESILPTLSYVDHSGEPIDWLFDGILTLGLKTEDGKRDFQVDSILEDWEWYLDKTFGADGDLHVLNDTVHEVSEALGEPAKRLKVVMMVPFINQTISYFGELHGESINLNHEEVGINQSLANSQKVLDWYFNEVSTRFEDSRFSHLELSGMYALAEGYNLNNPGDENIYRYMQELIHREGLTYFWIPYYRATRFYEWETFGFDAAVLQPNYFFDASIPYDRFEHTTNFAKRFGMGVEIEFDNRMHTDPVFRQRFIDYLNAGVEYGFMEEAFKAYYHGNKPLYQAAMTNNPNQRILYDWLYQFLNNDYFPQKGDFTIESLHTLLEHYAHKGVIEPAYANDMKQRLHLIEQMKAQGAISQAIDHLNDLVQRNHEKSVLQQGLLTETFATIFTSFGELLLSEWEKEQ